VVDSFTKSIRDVFNVGNCFRFPIFRYPLLFVFPFFIFILFLRVRLDPLSCVPVTFSCFFNRKS
jgi:hypothetical protein